MGKAGSMLRSTVVPVVPGATISRAGLSGSRPLALILPGRD